MLMDMLMDCSISTMITGLAVGLTTGFFVGDLVQPLVPSPLHNTGFFFGWTGGKTPARYLCMGTRYR